MVSAGETWGEKDACMWGGWYLERNLGPYTSLQVFWKQWRGKPLKEWHQGSVAQLAGLLCRTEGHGFPSHISTRRSRQRSISRVRSPVPHIASSTEGQMVVASAELRCLHRRTRHTSGYWGFSAPPRKSFRLPFQTEMTAHPALERTTQKQALLLI